jgi:hypothetical protein
VKKIVNYNSRALKLLRLASFALISVILFIQGANAFHSHDLSKPKSHQKDKSVIDNYSPACSVCYYLSDKQNKQLNYSPDNTYIDLNRLVEKLFILNLNQTSGLSIPGHINKGPPTV